MSTSSSRLIYGVLVSTWTLFVAANAYPKLLSPLLAIDLILARVSRGELERAEGHSDGAGVDDLPVEIWELIKLELVKRQLCVTARSLLKTKLRCEGDMCCGCRICCSRAHCTRFFDGNWRQIRAPGDCEGCQDMVEDFWAEDVRRLDAKGQIATLLKRYGLHLSVNTTLGKLDLYEPDLQSFLPISASPSSKLVLETSADTVDIGKTAASASWVDMSSFDTSPDSNQRIQRLVNDYLLLTTEPGQDLTELGVCATASAPARGAGSSGAKLVVKGRRTVQARWMLYNTCFHEV